MLYHVSFQGCPVIKKMCVTEGEVYMGFVFLFVWSHNEKERPVCCHAVREQPCVVSF